MAFQIIHNDITKVKAEAIVNTANPEVLVGPGVDTAVYNAAGREWLLEERARVGKISIGDVAVTPAGNLGARLILHESGPTWIDGKHGEAELLRQCYDKCLKLAYDYKCASVAFPLLASGAYRFPKDVALQIAIDAFRDFLRNHEIEIYLVLFDEQSVQLSESMFDDVKAFVGRNFRPEGEKCAKSESVAHDAPDEDAVYSRAPKTRNVPKPDMVRELSNSAPAPARPAAREKMAAKRVPMFKALESSGRPVLGKIPDSGKKINLDESPSEHKGRTVFSSSVPSKSLDTYVERFEHQDVLTFGEYLQQLINKKGMTNAEVYFEANLTKQYFSKIINNKLANPAKEKILCIAVALKLNIDETRDFLLHAGYALSPYSKIDLVFEYYIRKGDFNVYEISFALEDVGIEGGLWPELQ